MPLSFRSENYGNIAFGFFNIESDMLLLEKYFFFADDFCRWISQMAKQNDKGQKKFEFPVYYIADSNDIGDLMGAIHGIRFQGFIGRLYTLFPFPSDPKAFKQNPEGHQTREIVTSEIDPISEKTEVLFEFFKVGHVHIGPYIFDKDVFQELILYVWKGGYPHWKNETPPSYVLEMKTRLQQTQNRFFKGVFPS